MDETIDFSSQTVSNPYAITVDSAMPNGKTSEFSSYGQTSTEVFAPGSNHLSTIPTVMTAEVDAKTDAKSFYSRIIRYFPQATAPENRIAYETFEGTSGVRVFNENPAINSNAKELTASTGSVGHGDQRSLAVSVSSMNKQEWDNKLDIRWMAQISKTTSKRLIEAVWSRTETRFTSSEAMLWTVAAIAGSGATMWRMIRGRLST